MLRCAPTDAIEIFIVRSLDENGRFRDGRIVHVQIGGERFSIAHRDGGSDVLCCLLRKRKRACDKQETRDSVSIIH